MGLTGNAGATIASGASGKWLLRSILSLDLNYNYQRRILCTITEVAPDVIIPRSKVSLYELFCVRHKDGHAVCCNT